MTTSEAEHQPIPTNIIPIFHALSTEGRWGVVSVLRQNLDGLTFSELRRSVGSQGSTLSNYLKELKDSHLVEQSQRGKGGRIRISPIGIVTYDHLSAMWGDMEKTIDNEKVQGIADSLTPDQRKLLLGRLLQEETDSFDTEVKM